MLKKEDLNYLDDVRKYGTRLARYDKIVDDKIDDTNTIFIYEYEGYSVYIIMQCADYIRYFKRKITKQEDKDRRDFNKYEKVRKSGLYNMFDDRARLLTGLTKERYLYIINHYDELWNLYLKE